jgi:hypothetical protein
MDKPVIGPRQGIAMPRHPLGLPAGSVRALLTFMVLGMIWALLLLPKEKEIRIPLYLFYLMFLILGHFFAAHGHSIAGPKSGVASPLNMPRGSLRTLIFLGFVGVLGWRYYVRGGFEDLIQLEQPISEQPYLPFVLVGAFLLGVLLSRLVATVSGAQGISPWYQDFQAWIALLATLGLVAEMLIQLVINPSLEPDKRLQLNEAQLVLAAIVSFYFGARS